LPDLGFLRQLHVLFDEQDGHAWWLTASEIKGLQPGSFFPVDFL